MTIPVQRTTHPRPRVADADLGFGKVFTDHMFRVDWTEGKGWHDARVEPYGPISLDPAASAIHYGQEIFEGMKVYRSGGALKLFRPRAHARRLAVSAKRLCIPEPPDELLLEGVRTVTRTDADWMPTAPGTSIYVRPFIFATEPFLGVRPAKTYTLLVILSPVGAYFSGPPRPLRIWVERHRARAAAGGIGASKAAANYVASLLAGEEAKARGFDQVLWLDAAEHKWVEEIGTMNFAAKIAGKVVTPPLGGTILAGITRDTVLTLLRDKGVPVEERPVSIDELALAGEKGTLEELFGTGTASVVAPIGELAWEGRVVKVPAPGAGAVGEALRSEVLAIQRGDAPDKHGWMEAV